MKVFQAGDKIKAVCDFCKDICPVTFWYKPYKTETSIRIPNVLQGFCDRCNKRLVIPPQSTPRISPYYLRQNVVEEFRVPRAVEDVLYCLSAEFRIEKPEFFKTLLRYYLTENHGNNWIMNTELRKVGKADSRLSFRIDDATDQLLQQQSKELLISKSKYVTLMIWDAKDRLLEKTAISKKFTEETRLLRIPELMC